MTHGIDVSHHNAVIDWKKVKQSGKVDFAIIRAGYGKVISQKDKQFENNYAGCKSQGIPCGAYWYSYASSVSEIKTEAELFLKVIAGKQFEYPVYLDMEETSQQRLGKAKCSEMAKTFLDILEKAGYYAGLYSSKSMLENCFTESVLNRYTVWVANIGVSKTTYKYTYAVWQYTWKGRVDGVTGNNNDVDCNYCYVDFPALIKGLGLNGFEKPTISKTETVEPGEKVDVSKMEITTPTTNNKQYIEYLAAEIINGIWGDNWQTSVVSALSGCVDGIKSNPGATETYYRVVTGDTLTKIAKQFNTTADKLVSENKTAYPSMTKDFICVGWVLKV